MINMNKFDGSCGERDSSLDTMKFFLVVGMIVAHAL